MGRVANKSVSSDNLGLKIVNKFTNLSKIGFSMEFFTVDSSQFSDRNVNFAFSVAGCVFATKCRNFRDFLEIS